MVWRGRDGLGGQGWFAVLRAGWVPWGHRGS